MFSELIFKGVVRNRKDNGRKKGGLKVHMLIDEMKGFAQFIKITSANINDVLFLHDLIVEPFSMLVFDKAYNSYKLFARWTAQKVWFVTRMKENALYRVVSVSRKARARSTAGVLSEETIELTYKEEGLKLLELRRIGYQDEKGRKYTFITNNFDITAQQVADIYKRRWQIELLFKKMKQNFQLRYFYGESENAIRIQVWCTLIAQLLLTILHGKTKTKKAFSNVACIVRQHLLSYVNIEELLKNAKRYYDKLRKHIDYSNSLFPNYGGLGFG
jgi:transposase